MSLAPDDDRLHALDVLRGLALFAMILVHFHQKMRVEMPGVEDLIGWAVYILLEQKAWGTFAFLFGAGFAILLRRLDARQSPVTAIYLRRLATLAVFGVIAEVGFGFHILFTYACWGVALLVVRRWSTQALVVTALVAVVARPIDFAVRSARASSPARSATMALRQDVNVAAAEGTYRELLTARARLFVATTPGSWRGLLPDINLALFILGLLAVRHRVLDEPARHVRLIAGWMAFGALSWLLAWLGLPYAFGLGLVEDQWLCLTYVGAVLLFLARHPAWIARLAPFRQAGRMALTNYMLQGILLDVLASAYGFGLKLRPFAYVPAALGLFALEAGASMFWLSRYRFGPLEWIWRSATYWRWQPSARMSDLKARS